MAEEFEHKWNFPHCLGAIDGKHVNIKKPPGSGSFYFNYKKFFSIVLMAVVNANYEFLMVDVEVNGRVSDGGVISHTEFGYMLSNNTLQLPEPTKLHSSVQTNYPFVFIGDDAFAMTENLLKPYSEATGRLTLEQRIFNYRLSRARHVVENAFGILATRFGVFQRPMQLSPEKATTVTLACCHLHNFLRKKVGVYVTVADPGGGGLGGLNPPLQRLVFLFFACQYMKIPTDLDPKPPLRRILAQNPPVKNS